MEHLAFEWDEKKSASNEKKHGVSFDEAKSIHSSGHKYPLKIIGSLPLHKNEWFNSYNFST